MDFSVKYGDVDASGGVQLSVKQAGHAPTVSISGDEAVERSAKLMTLLMTDPDAPSREHPTNAEWLHWMVTNIPGGDVSAGDQVVPYNGPAPPAGTGKHRYIFTLYAQGGEGPLQVAAPAHRAKFHSKDFAASHGLATLATTFFTCEHA